MKQQEQMVDPRKQEIWDNEFRQYGIKVLPETAMYYEMETFFPSYVLVEKSSLDKYGVDFGGEQVELASSRLAFFTRDDRSYLNDEDGGIRWFEIEPVNVLMARMRMLEMMPQTGIREGVEGYVVPLQENNFFGSEEDVTAYLHNLMFWESLIKESDSGPLTQRYAWLSQRLYAMRCDQRDSIIRLSENGMKGLGIDTDSTAKIVEYALGQRKQEMEELMAKLRSSTHEIHYEELIKSTLYRMYEQMDVSDRRQQESQMRQEDLMRRMSELQSQMHEESVRARMEKDSLADMWRTIMVKFEEVCKDEK